MISKGFSVHQVAYDLLREMLWGILRTVVESGPRTGIGMGSVSWRACAALYCWSRDIRWIGGVGASRVDVRVRFWGGCGGVVRCGVAPCFWLHQADERLLLDLLARELDQHLIPSAGADERVGRSGSGQEASVTDPDITDVLPRINRNQDDPPSHAPTASRSPLSGAGSPSAGRSIPGQVGAGRNRRDRSPAEDCPAEGVGRSGCRPAARPARSTTSAGCCGESPERDRGIGACGSGGLAASAGRCDSSARVHDSLATWRGGRLRANGQAVVQSCGHRRARDAAGSGAGMDPTWNMSGRIASGGWRPTPHGGRAGEGAVAVLRGRSAGPYSGRER